MLQRKIILAAILVIVLVAGFVVWQKDNQGPFLKIKTDAFTDAAESQAITALPAQGFGALAREAGGAMDQVGKISVPTSGGESAIKDRKEIVNARLDIKTDDLEDSVKEVKQKTEQAGGYVSHSDYSSDTVSTATITIRVQKDKFTILVEDLGKIGLKLERSSVNSVDVTEEFVDLEGRLKNLRAQEAQYQELLKRTGSISDVLQVTQRLDEVRLQIESTTGRLEYLTDRTDYSEVTVYLHTEKSAEDPGDVSWRPWQTIKQQTKNMLASFAGFGDFIIALVFFIPTLLVWLVLLFIFAWILWKIARWIKHKIE